MSKNTYYNYYSKYYTYRGYVKYSSYAYRYGSFYPSNGKTYGQWRTSKAICQHSYTSK